jgi:heme o synthase
MGFLRDFLSLIKIGIVASNALTAAAGFALAASRSGQGLPCGRGGLVLAGTALLVAGTCAVNNWLDRDIDALMARTRSRPTARGALGAAQALGIGATLGICGLALLGLIGPVPAALGLGAALVYLLPYTLWSKRRGPSSLYIGGIAGSLPPLIGWAAIDPRLAFPSWLLFAFLAVWQQAHVRALALRRADEYRGAGLPMAGLGTSPARENRGARLAVLGWAAATLPFPALAICLKEGPITALQLGLASGAAALGLAWIAWGLSGLRSPSWPGRMFAASLVYLVLVFFGLGAAGA